MGKHSQAVIDRFWSRVEDRPSGCREWTGFRNALGYGQLKVRTGSAINAHRFAYEVHHGVALDPSQVVRHTCDNPSCVNPNHLRLGTHADNVADRVQRKRSAIGERSGRAKLSALQARNVMYRSGSESAVDLAREYGVDPGVVRAIREGRTWVATLAAIPRKYRGQLALEID